MINTNTFIERSSNSHRDLRLHLGGMALRVEANDQVQRPGWGRVACFRTVNNEQFKQRSIFRWLERCLVGIVIRRLFRFSQDDIQVFLQECWMYVAIQVAEKRYVSV